MLQTIKKSKAGFIDFMCLRGASIMLTNDKMITAFTEPVQEFDQSVTTKNNGTFFDTKYHTKNHWWF